MERHVQENVNKRKQNRRSLKKNKLSRKENKNNKPFVFIGNNCAKISNKIDSFNKVLHDLTPSVFALQETKRKKDDPPIKAENLKNYQVFELKREIEKKDGGKGLAGGGLAVGALHELNPVLTRIGNDEVECLSINIEVGRERFKCVSGYGPQLNDSNDRKRMFWKYLEEEVNLATKNDEGIIIQIDSNAWAGKEIIPSDPNDQNKNGKLLKQFMKNNKDLTIVNSLPCCDGAITRYRKTTIGEEESILDLFIVCKKVFPLIRHMKVDHEGKYKLTKFGKDKTTETDHHTVILTLDLSLKPNTQPRKELFNFRDPECQMKFFNMTSKTSSLSKCLATNETYEIQVKKWEKKVQGIFHQSFVKIRERKRKFREDEIGFLIEKRKKVKTENTTPETTKEIEELEIKIAKKSEEHYVNKIKEALGDITGENGKINDNGVWKSMRKIFPKHEPPKPMALKDKAGKLITNHEHLKETALEAIVERLRKRPIHPEMKRLEKLKIKLAHMRLKLCRRKKSLPWTLKNMNQAIKSMKNKKCRDPEGLVNEILKPGVAGLDFQMSLLSLINQCKEQLEIPHMMRKVNIALIPKTGKKDIHNINNHRGIFLIHKYRSLILRMMLNDEYHKIDKHMSDSNVGGRKERGIRDHLFIVNGVIHEHKDTNEAISIQIFDFKSCFDSMWSEENVNDLYNAGMTNDRLALLHKINETNEISVKTAVGNSNVKIVKNIICQGDPWGSIECSCMVDSLGKESLKPELNPYQYKGKVNVPLLGMVDDMLCISKSGPQTMQMNSFVNVRSAMKRLQFNSDKCHIMHIGKDIKEFDKMDFYLDGWKLTEVEEVETGVTTTKETFDGEQEVDETENEKYLGQILSRDGSNTANINQKVGKGIGMKNKIKTILEHRPGGKYHFEIAVILRNAFLISSMISSSEVWYNITENEYRQLERTDETLIREIFNCSSQVTHEMLYLELGVLPIRFLIKMRRILYLEQILKQRIQNSLIYRFFIAQMTEPTNNDWATQVMKDINDIKLEMELKDIEEVKSEEFEKVLKKKIRISAFEYLETKKKKNKSVKHIIHEKLQMCEYLKGNEIETTVSERQFLFKCRTNDTNVRENRKWKFEATHCTACDNKTQPETQQHILECSILTSLNYNITYNPTYNDIFNEDVSEQIYVSRTINENILIRDQLNAQAAHVN